MRVEIGMMAGGLERRLRWRTPQKLLAALVVNNIGALKSLRTFVPIKPRGHSRDLIAGCKFISLPCLT